MTWLYLVGVVEESETTPAVAASTDVIENEDDVENYGGNERPNATQ